MKWKLRLSFFPCCDVYPSETASEIRKKCRAGLDFVLRELIGSLEVGRCKQNGGRFECQFTFSCGGFLSTGLPHRYPHMKDFFIEEPSDENKDKQLNFQAGIRPYLYEPPAKRDKHR